MLEGAGSGKGLKGAPRAGNSIWVCGWDSAQGWGRMCTLCPSRRHMGSEGGPWAPEGWSPPGLPIHRSGKLYSHPFSIHRTLLLGSQKNQHSVPLNLAFRALDISSQVYLLTRQAISERLPGARQTLRRVQAIQEHDVDTVPVLMGLAGCWEAGLTRSQHKPLVIKCDTGYRGYMLGLLQGAASRSS